MNLFNFEEDNLNVDDVIKWIYTTQDLRSILSDTKKWFRFRRRDLVWEQVSSCSWHKHCGKEDERNSKAKSLSQLHKSWSPKSSYNGHICSLQWPQSCLMQQKTVRGSAQWWNAQTLYRESLILVFHLHTSRTRKVILTVQNFPINQRRTDEYFQLQGMFSSCNIGSVNAVLKENWE